MQNTIVALSLLAGSVSAQQVTASPKSLFKAASSFNIKAVNNAAEDDISYCLDAEAVLLECADSWGGPDEILNQDPEDVINCACCDGATPIYSDYASCASYMEEEMPAFTEEADLYSQLADQCEAFAVCSGSASATSLEPEETTTSDEVESTTTSEESSMITSGAAAADCDSMYGMFEICMEETSGFESMPFRSQAECYCCGSSRGQTEGTLTWTDELDQYASTCWAWAESSATDTQWDYASTFATFCDNFSDICDGMSVTAESAEETETDTEASTTAEETGEEVTVTVTNTRSQSSETDDPDAAAGLRAGSAGIIGAVLAGLLML